MAKIVTGPEDYFRSVEKRLTRLERRPVVQDAADLLGPGIASQAVQIMDWSSSDAVFNGYFHTEVGGINSPDSALTWTGQVIAKDDGTGMQQVWNTDGPETLYYMRTYAPDSSDPSQVIFTEWKRFATASGLIGVDEIDPEYTNNLPVPDLTDGEPPGTAPTVQPIGGIGSMFFRWDEVPNADPVTYRLHVAADRTPLLDGSDEVASGVGLTMASVREMADGTAIVGDGTVVYHAVVTVEDADTDPADPPVASVEVTGTPAQVTGADIAVNAITSDLLITNDAVVGALEGETITGVTITAPNIQTATGSDQGIHLDSAGLRAYGPSGLEFFNVKPSEGVVITTGRGTFDTLTVNVKSELGGSTEVKSGSALQLTSGTTAPSSAPIVGETYDTTQFTDDGKWANRYGWSTDGTYWYTARDSGSGAIVEKWNTDGTLNSSGTSVYGSWFPRGSVVSGTTLWLLLTEPSGLWVVIPASTSTLAASGGANWWNDASGSRTPAIFYDSAVGHIIIAQSRSGGTIRFRRYTHNGSGATLSDVASGYVDVDPGYVASLSGMFYGQADFNTVRYVASSRSSGPYKVYTDSAFGSPATEQEADEWPSGMPDKVGFTFSGTRWFSMDFAGVMRTYTSLDWNINHLDSTQNWKRERWFYWTWYRSSGPYESPASPGQRFIPRKRSKMVVSATSALPTSPGANDPTSVRFYVGKDADSTMSEPPRTSLHLQTTQPTAPAVTIEYESTTDTGAAPPDPDSTTRTDKFPDALPSKILGTRKRSDGTTPQVYIPDFGQVTLDGLLPPGSMMEYPGTVEAASDGRGGFQPKGRPGWLVCDGTQRSRTLDRGLAEALFDGSNYVWGNGDGSTTFNLPNFTNRVAIGAGTKALGTTGGSETKTITASNLPPHTHGIPRAGAVGGNASTVARGDASAAGDSTTGSGGFANDPLNIMPPWAAVYYIIKL
jgi:microcystin-dependent protein